LNVLHVVAPGNVGGLERVVQSLTGAQCAAGHLVSAAVIHERRGDDHPLTQSLRARGVDVIPVPVGARGYLTERAAVKSIARRIGPEIVHTHGYRPDVVDAPVARRLDLATVTTVHGFTGGDWKNRLYECLQRRAFRRFDAVVAVSEPLGGALARSGVPKRSLHVIPNAWDDTVTFLDREAARALLGVPSQEVRIGWAGRLSEEKGPDLMLEALALLGDGVTLSMLGDGGRPGVREELRARAEKLGVAKQVTWHGLVPDAARLFRAFDVFALSSRTEGTPIVLFEAMAAGIPVVASAVGGVPNVVSSTEALLVSPNDPQALAAALRRACEDQRGGAQRAAAARARLQRDFALEPWLDRYMKVYRAVRR
jgi:glycosyltransferase involved in cell wall biosynthesis